MIHFAKGGPGAALEPDALRGELAQALDGLGERRRVLVVPPDITRVHSRAGDLTRLIHAHYGDRIRTILPAVGTHAPMSEGEIAAMFGDLPRQLFAVHDWRRDVATLGVVPGSFLAQVSQGRVDYDWPVQLNRMLPEGGFDLILSIGQVVPHEVVGMANHSKNLFVGTGGAEAIHRSHFLGAVYGMERIMGRADTPVRAVLDYACREHLATLPVVYLQTVVEPAPGGGTTLRGLFMGDDRECFDRAATLAAQVNCLTLPRRPERVVVSLDPAEYKSTWLGNKAIYRTRLAIADGGELIVLAPGVDRFGEDREIDALIRKYGYRGTPAVMSAVRDRADLRENLAAAAHLIHGSTEGRFRVTYCPGGLSRQEVEGVGFEYGDLGEMTARYDARGLAEGFNCGPDGGEFYYITNPGLGLWRGPDEASGSPGVAR